MIRAVQQLPTRLNVDQAWSEYHALALEGAERPALMASVHFCIELARAWERWRDLFLVLDRAA